MITQRKKCSCTCIGSSAYKGRYSYYGTVCVQVRRTFVDAQLRANFSFSGAASGFYDDQQNFNKFGTFIYKKKNKKQIIDNLNKV